MKKFFFALILVVVAAAAAFIGYREESARGGDLACTQEAKICPDGSAVGRQGPRCDFAECPAAAKDPACTGDAHEYFSLGFGVEHRYEGEVVPGKPVVAVLSCDHSRLTISGGVTQVIGAADVSGLEGEIADLSGGSLVVSFEDDYNFDGYRDLSSVVSNGQGMSAIDTYVVFLYEPSAEKFVFSDQLSALENIFPNEEEKRIEQAFCYYDGAGEEMLCDRAYHRWQNGRLVEVLR